MLAHLDMDIDLDIQGLLDMAENFKDTINSVRTG